MTKPRIFRAVFALAVAIGLAAGVSACNTVEGIGKDISAAGRALGAGGSRNN